MDTVEIDGNSHLHRDLYSKALLNTNRSEISRYEHQKAIIERNKTIAEDVTTLKQEMAEIKELLHRLTAR